VRNNSTPSIPEDVKGVIFNIQKYCIHDGPGIRTTVFMKGCPLRCLWCSNPESQNLWQEVAHRDSLCTRCGLCVDVCSVKAISVNENKSISIDRTLCTNCGNCIDVCVPGALKFYGEEKSVSEVFREIEKDADFYRNSGGGVTASGGEPLMQPAFVSLLFKLCREIGISTCLETTGFSSVSALKAVLPYTSLVLFDVKLSNPASHRKWTGRSNGDILKNLRFIADKGTPVIIRVPLIIGVNDSVKELKGIAEIAADVLKESARINLLPYHRYGVGKYQMLDRRYQLHDMKAPTEAELKKAKAIIEFSGLSCQIVK
jgi:pyruvate formate lyase activating enzyme